MNFKNWFTKFFYLWLGITIGQTVITLRLYNDILAKEMIIYLQDGINPLIIFVIMDLLFLLGLSIYGLIKFRRSQR